MESKNAIYAAATLAVLVFAFVPGVIHPVASATSTETGLIVPLYEYPTDSAWPGLIQAKHAYPSVPVIAIADPTSSGPGSSSDPNFASGIADLQAAGITVIGYIGTNYGSESTATVEKWVNDYQTWYHVNGIFFDEMSNAQSDGSYYTTVSSYAHSLGLLVDWGNPGASVPSSFIGTVNLVINIYENPGYPSASSIQSAAMGYARTNFGMMAYGVGAPTQSYFQSVIPYVSYIYFTDQSGSNPYNALPSFLDTEMSQLSSVDGSTTATSTTTVATTSTSASVITTASTQTATTNPKTTSTTHTTTTTTTKTTTLTSSSTSSQSRGTLVVQSDMLSGTPLDGLWTVIQSASGATVATGYTPLTFHGTIGTQYTVNVSNYRTDVFNHWDSGSTDATRSFTLGATTTLTAYYNT
jgi:hypothetical protein